jgi:hypothetical protein
MPYNCHRLCQSSCHFHPHLHLFYIFVGLW